MKTTLKAAMFAIIIALAAYEQGHFATASRAAFPFPVTVVMPVGIMIEEHAELRTPVSGRIGDRRASRGNLVPDGTSGHTILLAAIEPIDPIHFGSIFEDASYVRHALLQEQRRRGRPRVHLANQA
jgi:hypothetical protein